MTSNSARREMIQPKAYDKSKWHDEAVAKFCLPAEHASHHIVFFFRWCIENDFIIDWLRTEWPDDYAAVCEGRLSALAYFEQLDRCFVDDMLSDEGNAFASAYFDYETGCYIQDLTGTLQGSLPLHWFRIDFPAHSVHYEYGPSGLKKVTLMISETVPKRH